MSESTTFPIGDVATFKQKALLWAAQFNVCCCLDSNQYAHDKYSQYDYLLAVDALSIHELDAQNTFEELKALVGNKWLFGFLSYDLKNEVEQLQSRNASNFSVPNAYFFEPRYLLTINNDKVSINRSTLEASFLMDSIEKMEVKKYSSHSIHLQNTTSKVTYLQHVAAIQQHILEGDMYEMNYCTEFVGTANDFQPVPFFHKLNQQSKAPFSSFLKINQQFAMGASPERFLQKNNNQLVAQPIKGTIKKGATETENEALKQQLQNDPKERAENVMIVDLMRNDLTKSAITGSIEVPELFEVYGFATINQMISTITATLRKDIHPVDAIKNAFPMGSMTGAPKVKVMELIEQYENFKRGLYSGSIGYFQPNTKFDFNVVIRTLFYDASTKVISLPVGGAITFDSIPEKEYEEIHTKAATILSILKGE